jgi:hypothetical protein
MLQTCFIKCLISIISNFLYPETDKQYHHAFGNCRCNAVMFILHEVYRLYIVGILNYFKKLNKMILQPRPQGL